MWGPLVKQASKEVEFDEAKDNSIEDWFKEDVFVFFSNLMLKIAEVIGKTDEELETIEESSLDEAYVERLARVLKAGSYDKIAKLLMDAVI